MNSNELLIQATTFIILLTITLLYYKQARNFKVGAYVIAIYALSAIMGIVYMFQPYAWYYLNGQSTWWPIIYWMILFFITCIPIFEFDKKRIDTIEYDPKLIYRIAVFGFVISIIPFLEQAFLARSLFDSVTVALDLHDEEGGMDKLSSISRFLLRINISLYDLSFVILLLLLLEKKKRKFPLFCVVFIIITRNLTGVITGHRSSFIEVMQKLILVALIAYPLQTKENKKKMIKLISYSFALFFGFFLLITIGRSIAYEEKNSEFTLLAFLSRYMGEPLLLFNEYLPLMKANSDGQLTCNFFLDILGLTSNELDHAYMYGSLQRTTGIPQNVFYSYIGDFVMDFGFVAAFIILTGISLFFWKLTRFKNGKIALSTLFIFVMYTSILMGGITSWKYNGSHGKFLLFSFFVYFLLKIHENKNRTRLGNSKHSK